MKIKKIIAAAAVSLMLSASVLAASAYTVRAGDTAWKIAADHSVTLSELRQANPGVPDLASIRPGQKLTIPDSMSSYENQVVTLVNQRRSQSGLPALKRGSTTSYVAQLKARDMATKGYFSHQSPTYGSPFTMLQNFGLRFSAAGENIAYGQQTPQAVMNAWMNSAGHRANILSRSYTFIGVGAGKNKNGVIYWTQEFVKPM